MPVVVVGASSSVGRALVPLLVERAPEVRAIVRSPSQAEGLRALGAKVAVARAPDPDALAMLFHDAHTVCHLAGGMRMPSAEAYEEANLETVRRTVEGARTAGAERILFLSTSGADPEDANAYLRSKGRAEELVRGSGLEHAIVRATRLVAPASPWFRDVAALAARRPAAVVGDGSASLAPVASADVAAILAAADDRAGSISTTLGVEGPDVVTADDLVGIVAGRRRRPRHLALGARASRAVGEPVA
ncbi:MAG TPA: NAD(P)H-binding protein [Actinomycetota bacterium]